MDWAKLFQRVADKLTSARFLVTVIMVSTFCLITINSLSMFIKYLENEKVIGLVREIVMFILGAFCTQVGGVISSYFNRADRQKPENGGQK